MPQIFDHDELDGQFLIAMPGIEDPRFRQSVVYLCAHSNEASMGIILNQANGDLRFGDLLSHLDLGADSAQIKLRPDIAGARVHCGGPVDSGRGFVLHSDDYFAEQATLSIGDGICMTATIDILKAMSKGKGPAQSLLALGYAGWGPGQLETEIKSNGWMVCPADSSIMFHAKLEERWSLALERVGIRPEYLSHLSGSA